MHLLFLPLLALLLALNGCAEHRPPTSLPAQSPEPATVNAHLEEQPPAWIRQGRYTLVNTQPTQEQRLLLLQMVEIHLSSALHATVGDGVRHVLQHSGYALCADAGSAAALLQLPLPAVHYQLGPVPLLEALTLLAGPAWELSVDPIRRSVCYAPRSQEPAPLPMPELAQ